MLRLQVPPTRNLQALSMLGYTLGTSGNIPRNYYLDVAFTGNKVRAVPQGPAPSP